MGRARRRGLRAGALHRQRRLAQGRRGRDPGRAGAQWRGQEHARSRRSPAWCRSQAAPCASAAPTSPRWRRTACWITASPSCRRPRTSSPRSRCSTTCGWQPTGSPTGRAAAQQIDAMFDAFPDLARQRQAPGRPPVGRAAPDAGRGPGPDRLAPCADARRAFGGTVAEAGRRGVQPPDGDPEHRRRDRPGGAERARRARHRGPGPGAGRRLQPARGAAPAELARDPVMAELYLGGRAREMAP